MKNPGIFTQGGGPPCRYTLCNTPCHCRDGNFAMCKESAAPTAVRATANVMGICT